MSGAASPELRDPWRVVWHDDVAWPATASGPLPRDVDVVIIGAGYCGLAAADAALSHGASVCVVDRGDVGDGASSRNGGMVIPELKMDPAALQRRFGDLGVRLQRDVDEAFDWVEGLIDDGSFDCDYERSGQLYLAHNERAAARLEKMASQGDAEVLRGRALAREIGSDRFPAGMVSERTGGLQPARFHAALMRRVIDAGALIHPRVEVTGLARRGRRHLVRTDVGDVRAGHVVVATNAYGTESLHRFSRGVLPVGSFIVATKPLRDDVAEAILPTRRMCFDTKNFLWYWRLDATNRLIFGGRRSLGTVELADAREFLRRSIAEVYPGLAIEVDACWGGFVAITLDRLPHAGVIDGVHYATGCNGSGVALNTYLGHRVGMSLFGEPMPACAELPHRAIPARWAQPAYMPIVGRWFRWQDHRS